VSSLTELPWKKRDEVHDVLRDLIDIHHRRWIKTFRVKSLDEDEKIRRVIELFEKNSLIKGSVGNVTIYVAPMYFYYYGYGEVLVASLIIERDSSGYTVKIGYWDYTFQAPSSEEAKSIAEEKISDIIRLLERALATKHPNAPRIAGLSGCYRGVKMSDLLRRLYGDEILNDTETISGLHSVCSRETDFFVNNKVIAIPDLGLLVVRDKDSGRIFIYDYREAKFYEVSPEEKIFYDALFIGSRDLLEPEEVVEEEEGFKYALSSSEVVVGGKKVVLAVAREYSPVVKKWYVRDMLAIACDGSAENKCLIYSFDLKHILRDVRREIEIWKHIFSGFGEAMFSLILRSRRIHGETRGRVAKDIAEKYEWEILPA
jgi:hypothetical protein